jgi:hypothetical protein
MGRKGVSKRKEKKTKAVVNDAAANSVASVIQASDNKPFKTPDSGSTKNNSKKK